MFSLQTVFCDVFCEWFRRLFIRCQNDRSTTTCNQPGVIRASAIYILASPDIERDLFRKFFLVKVTAGWR